MLASVSIDLTCSVVGRCFCKVEIPKTRLLSLLFFELPEGRNTTETRRHTTLWSQTGKYVVGIYPPPDVSHWRVGKYQLDVIQVRLNMRCLYIQTKDKICPVLATTVRSAPVTNKPFLFSEMSKVLPQVYMGPSLPHNRYYILIDMQW